MRKYSDDPIVDFVHRERMAREKRMIELIDGPRKKRKKKSKRATLS